MKPLVMKNSSQQKALSAGFVIIFLLSWSSFIFTPMTGDLKVFMASAHQAQYISGNLIIGAFRAWELKSVVSRVIMCFIYKIACVFVPFNTYAFEVVSKAIYSILLILMVFISMKMIFGNNKYRARQNTIIVSSLLMAMHTGCQMQVEMTATLFVLFAFALYLNAIENEKHKIPKLLLAGVFIGALFYLKSVLILLSIIVVAAICIYAKEKEIKLSFKRMMIVVVGSLLSLGIIAIMIVCINPSEFTDMIDASTFQETLFSTKFSIGIIKTFFGMHFKQVLFIPSVLIGILCLFINLFTCFREKTQKWEYAFFHFVMWLMPALFILLSNKYFIYHFAVYLFPSIIEIYCVIHHWNRNRRILFSFASVIAIVWYIIMFSIVSSNVRGYIELDLLAYEKNSSFFSQVEFNTKEDTLYLDSGTGGYLLGNPSHIKYFFPLPLQRLAEDSTLKCHVEALEQAMSFEGKYVSVNNAWFFADGRYQSLKDKIVNEYDCLGIYYEYNPSHSLIDIGSLNGLELYERKER